MHENGESRFSNELYCLGVRKKSWEPLLSFRIFGISKIFMHIKVFFRFFCLTVQKNFVRNHLKFQNVSNARCRKVLCKGTEYQGFPSKIFCLGAEKFRWGTLCYIRKVRLSKNFMTKKLITVFSVEFFFTYTASKVRWRTPLCFRIFGTSKTFMLSRGQRKFPSFFLASQY